MDIVERLRWSGQDAMTKHLSLGMAKLHAEAAEEIEALRRFLEIALDEHDDHFGVTNAEKYPRNRDVQARRRLDGDEQSEWDTK